EGIHTYAEEGQFNIQVTVTDTLGGSAGTTAFYQEVNLVTDNQAALANEGFDPAAHTDPNLVNPWGVAFGPTSPFWVGDNNTGTANFLYATNFRQGTIDVFDTNFNKVTLGTGGFGTFTDPNAVPDLVGFGPFGIQNIGGQLFVTFAKKDPLGHDDVAGPGNG